jgi:drug/metabolite transporter (DMT)-like permease
MAYGALFTLVAGLVKGDPLGFDYSVPYIVSLLFLAIPGTVIGFWSFLTLIGRIGADRAAYAMLLFPIIALGLSTLAEGYIWTYNAFLGVALILAGNVLVLWRKSGKPESA